MTNRKFMVAFTGLIVSASLASSLGCGAEPATDDESSRSSALQSDLERTMTEYAVALERNDVATVDKLISTELRDRIETRGSSAEAASDLKTFVSRERDKLMRSIGTSTALRESLAVVSSKTLDDGAVATAEVTVGGEVVPKPFYFVLEDGSYKVNIVKPDIVAQEGNTYVVKNDDTVNRAFSCSGQSASTVAGGQTLSKFCDDACGFFDGTRFTVSGGSTDCDYNTWGIDMYIRNNTPVCADRC